MTHHAIRVLEDGTRVYSNGTRYKPVAPEDRVYKKHKPPVEGAFRIGGDWYLPLPLLPDEDRSWPETKGRDPKRTRKMRKRDAEQLKVRGLTFKCRSNM